MSTREQFQRAATDEDLLPIVNARDELIGLKPRRLVHLQGLRHRAVHLGVFDAEGRLWLQLRGSGKDTFPGHWDLSATGHVDPGESYDAAARRELREELGLRAEPAFIAKLNATERSGWEFHALYWLRWTGPLADYDRTEIERMRLFTIAEIEAALHGEVSLGPMTPGVADGLPHLLRAVRSEGSCPAGTGT